MNVEIGTEAVQFPEKEYINAVSVAVYKRDTYSSFSLMNLSRMGWILALYFSQKELEIRTNNAVNVASTSLFL
jgi:hypothetical protein